MTIHTRPHTTPAIKIITLEALCHCSTVANTVQHTVVYCNTVSLCRYFKDTTLEIQFVQHVITYSESMDQRGKVANPARGQLNRETFIIFPCLCSRLRIWPRDMGSAVSSRVSLLISILRLNLVLTHGIPPEFRDGVHLII